MIDLILLHNFLVIYSKQKRKEKNGKISLQTVGMKRKLSESSENSEIIEIYNSLMENGNQQLWSDRKRKCISQVCRFHLGRRG